MLLVDTDFNYATGVACNRRPYLLFQHTMKKRHCNHQKANTTCGRRCDMCAAPYEVHWARTVWVIKVGESPIWHFADCLAKTAQGT